MKVAGALILKQVARALDDVADTFIRHVKKMHKAEEAPVPPICGRAWRSPCADDAQVDSINRVRL